MAKKTKAPAEASTATQQPYYLQRAHIKDYRSIRDAKVEFKPGLNIIIGANGSGKTNFVRVASKGIDVSESRPMSDTSSFDLSGRYDVMISYEKEINEMQYNDFLDISFQPKYKQQVTVKTAANTKVGDGLMSVVLANYNALFPNNISFVYKALVISHGVPDPYPIVDAPNDFLANNWEELRIDAKFPASILSAISSSLITYVTDKDGSRITVEVVQNNIDAIATFFLESISEELKRYTPINNIRLSNNYSVYHNKQQGQFIVRGLSLEFRVASEWLPFQALSSGTQRMFYIVSELAIPSGVVIELDNNTKLHKHDFDKIIFLEEPELGIHPDQLHKLLQFLREQSEKHQLIITTHSPQVLDMLREDELDRITICELDEKKGTQFRKLKKSQIATAQKYMKEVGFLSDYWRHGSLEEKN